MQNLPHWWMIYNMIIKQTLFDFYPFDSFCTDTSSSSVLEELAYRCFERLSFTFVQTHLEHLIEIVRNSQNSDNDRYVAHTLLKNADIASRGIFALCQDTGIACVFAWKGREFVLPRAQEEAYIDDSLSLSAGIERVYKDKNLRFSTVVPDGFFGETDPANNLPAQIMLFCDTFLQPPQFSAFREEETYRFLFCAKGGGSSNKTSFIQGTKAILNEAAFERLLREEIAKLGTAACPPYTIAVIVGGLSPEHNMLTLKLATAGLYDTSPLRSSFWEHKIMTIAQETGFGAQFGGSCLALDALVLRLSRHAASVHISIGVSCSAHRNVKAYIDPSGIYIEKTVANLHEINGFNEVMNAEDEYSGSGLHINFDEGITSSLEKLHGVPKGTRLCLSGSVIVARDAAHARWKALVDEGNALLTAKAFALRPYLAKIFFSSEPAFTPILIGTLFFLQAATTSLTFKSLPILPGLNLILEKPISAQATAIL